jgi:hypothetical protein
MTKEQIKTLGPVGGFFIAIVLLIWIVISSFSGSDKTTVYSRTCLQENTSVQDCTSWSLSNGGQVYYIDKNSQQVMFDGDYGPVPYHGCHVVSKDNWGCNLLEGDSLLPHLGGPIDAFGYKNGVFVEDTPSSKIFATQHFGWLKYWGYKIMGVLNPPIWVEKQ